MPNLSLFAVVWHRGVVRKELHIRKILVLSHKNYLILKGNIFSFQKNAKTIKKIVGCYALGSILLWKTSNSFFSIFMKNGSQSFPNFDQL